MKSRFTNFIFVVLAFLPGISIAQIGNPPIKAIDDSLTVILGQAITYNVKANDTLNFPLPVQLDVAWVDIYPCIGLTADGTLKFLPDANTCVGDTLEYTYRYTVCNDSISKCSAKVRMIVQRIDDCFFVRMEDFIKQGQVDSPQCAFVCENSGSTFVATYNPSSTYTWSVTGGTMLPGVNPATINIAWGPKGAGIVSLTITNGDVSTTINACVVIMEGPTASFTTSSTHICKNATVTFNNTSTSGSSFFWDFGDGATSSASSVTHQYTTPGIHTACLTVTRKNSAVSGSPLCSCTDKTCVEIVVDSLAGPNIFCVSTLCAHDSTKYWTDAICDSLKWTVMENGLPVAFSGQGKDTICVQWGPGPLGTISLEAKGCTGAYCEAPVIVSIPIIAPTVAIAGKTELCAGSFETYTAPKWMGVYYDWEVMGAISTTEDGPNTITIQWGAVGTGTITLHYYSDFMTGLPGQDPTDCMGTATLNVLIKRTFQINTQPKTAVCANEVSTYTAFPSNAYNWTVSGGLQPLIMGNGSSSITVTWDSGPGNYTISAMPASPNPFCNDVATKYMQVLDVPPLPWIEGLDTICPGQTYTYFAQTNQVGIGFNWSVNNGGTWSTATVNPLTVTWGATGPYSLYLQQFMLADPMCSSDTVTLQVNPKMIDSFAIDGPKLVCINSLLDYSATPAQQDPDATYTWTILDPLLGSVVNGQGTPNIHVQWNNVPDTATLTLMVELCDSILSVSIPVIINAPRPLIIMQKDTLCEENGLSLEAIGSGFIKYLWSNSETTQTIAALANTIYTVTACDSNLCIVKATFNTDSAIVLTAPPSHLPDLFKICILPCDTSIMVTINAPTGPGTYSYFWTCDGISVINTSSLLTHTNTCQKDTFVYVVTLTDVNNGCTATSETTVIQTDICGGGSCDPVDHMLSFTATNQMPNCNIVDFVAMPVNATIIRWDFGDLSGAGPVVNPVHTYAEVGDYTVILYAWVLSKMSPPDSCLIADTVIVHIPLKAEFSCTSNCSKVTFTNLTTYNNLPGDIPINWLWEFGTSSSTSSLENPPMFTYPGPGNYTVTLTVMNADSCISVFTKPITVGGVSLDTILITPDTACVGTPLNFCGIPPDTNIVQWDWDFGDGSTNGAPKPFHSYLSPGTYTVELTVTDAEGCTDMDAISLDVHPSPAYENITVSPGLVVCDSTEVTLTAPQGDYTYLWSNSSMEQFIKTDSAGTYSVTITNAYGCTMVPDPVTIVVFSTPQAAISGNHYSCSNDPCQALSAPYGQHYTYLWSTGATSASIHVCNAGVYTVMVTDTSTNLKCSAVSASFSVFAAMAPLFYINIAPDGCEGKPVTLTVNNIQPDVVYNWNNAVIGTSITVMQAGTYYAIGTDTITGCVGYSFVVIHPQPDLCLVPAGCYEVCNPYTICAPGGLKNYQWNKDGAPIQGETDSCLIVTQSGTYSLTGTNSYSCMRTSDSLILTVIDCTCFGLSASASPAGTGDCCWNLSYNNPLNTLYSLNIHSNDADLSFNGLSGPFSTVSGINSITLSNVVSGMPLASGVLSKFLTVCLSNVQNMPQLILFDWYDANHNLLCSDTVKLFSQHILVDTLFLCPGKTVTLDGTPYSAPNIVTVNLPGVGGACDTLATYHLILSPVHSLTLTCPPSISVKVNSTDTTAIVNYDLPTATSTCPGSVPTLSITSVLPSGNKFPLGETQVCYHAKDGANCCSNEDDCCFKVTVTNEIPCDEQMTACVKFEMLNITKDAVGNQTYRMRITNSCTNNLIYAAFQVPDGIAAISPANNAIYTAPSSRTYIVRNPNFSPYYSIRFKSVAAGITNGQSEIFEYKLPPQVCQGCILATVRLAPQIFYQAHFCCMMPSSLAVTPTVFETADFPESPAARADELKPLEDGLPSQFAIFPNPTDGTLFADLSEWEGEQLRVQIYNSQGQQLQSLPVNASGVPQLIEMPNGLADGLYFLEILTGKDERQIVRFVLLR